MGMVLGQITFRDPKTKVFITSLFIQKYKDVVVIKIPEEEEECHGPTVVVETPSYLYKYHILQGTRARPAPSSLSNKASGR